MSLSNSINQYSIDHYLTFVNHFFNPSYNKKEVKLIVKHAKITKHDKVLDVPCGYGRISNLLSKYAHKVVGIDINKKFLEIARLNAKNSKNPPIYLQQDINSLKYINEFDVIIVLFTSFGMFNDIENQNFIANIAISLKYNGRFIIEVLNPEYFYQDMIKKFDFKINNQKKVSDHIKYVSSTQILTTKRVYEYNNTITDEVHQIKVYSISQITKMLERYSLDITSIKPAVGIGKSKVNKSRLLLFGNKQKDSINICEVNQCSLS